MKKLIVIGLALASVAFASSCGDSKTTENAATDAGNTATAEENKSTENPSYDPKRGEGKFTTVEFGPTLDVAKAGVGKKVYDVKCGSCHKLSDEKLVGPGWKGVTSRHAPEWIMNFITNTDAMIDKDPKVQAQLEICLVRMPNQSLTDDDARNLFEFMRENDGVK